MTPFEQRAEQRTSGRNLFPTWARYSIGIAGFWTVVYGVGSLVLPPTTEAQPIPTPRSTVTPNPEARATVSTNNNPHPEVVRMMAEGTPTPTRYSVYFDPLCMRGRTPDGIEFWGPNAPYGPCQGEYPTRREMATGADINEAFNIQAPASIKAEDLVWSYPNNREAHFKVEAPKALSTVTGSTPKPNP